LALAILVGTSVFGAGLTAVTINGKEYTNVNDVHAYGTMFHVPCPEKCAISHGRNCSTAQNSASLLRLFVFHATLHISSKHSILARLDLLLLHIHNPLISA
jgi:hypothetical protein